MSFRGYVRYSYGGIGANATSRANYRPPTQALINTYQCFRVAKYAVAIGFIRSYKWNAEWYLDELKQKGIYDYMIKRARFYHHMNKVTSMYQYGKTRMGQIGAQIEEQ